MNLNAQADLACAHYATRKAAHKPAKQAWKIARDARTMALKADLKKFKRGRKP